VEDKFTYKSNGEVIYPSDFIIISETDEKGNIRYMNQNFVDISGYTYNELIDQPHNIIRHPDMPRAAFKLVWDSIKQKGFWKGFVKNLRKDGKYYWVYATILREIEPNGTVKYLSIRTAPKRNEIEEAEILYSTLH
jgi:aerotaxis receptor